MAVSKIERVNAAIWAILSEKTEKNDPKNIQNERLNVRWPMAVET